MANNEGRAFTMIHGEPNVLYVDGEANQYLGAALREEGLNITQVDAGNMPTLLSQFQDFDAVVMCNVSSTDLTSQQLGSLEAVVRDLGIGLVMIGGPQSFGAGGYYDTPVERALPLNMDLKQRKVMPRGALALILHTMEFQDGNAWAREIGLASLDVLASQDLMGIAAYDYNRGDSWLIDLQPVGDKHRFKMALNTTTIGDMPDTQPTLKLAYDALVNADAAVKRVVMISDGDPAGPTPSLLRKLAAAKIAVSTVCINPHSPSDQSMLRRVAKATGGEYYFVTNPNNLPQIFTKEAAVVKRGLLIEEEFRPSVFHDSEILRGLKGDALPILRGYVATTPKDNATISLLSHEEDPVLAQWRYGLGKSIAFTSDVTNRWATEWLGWDGFNRFWAQTVRWALRDTTPSDFRVESKIIDGKGYVKIDAVDEQGNFINFLRPEGVVTRPGNERQELELVQTGPGIYEGYFPVDERGIYMMNITYNREDGGLGMIPAGLALNYSKEYDYNATNMALLEEMAVVGGGRLYEDPTENPFIHDLKATPTITPIWPYLAAFAACLFPFEIFVRRVVVDFSFLYVWALALLRKLPGLKRLIPKPKPRVRTITGTYGTQGKPSTTLVYSASGAGMPGDEAPPEGVMLTEGETVITVMEEGAAVAKERAASTDYTSQLLAAKARALDKRSRRARSDDNDNQDENG
jgi:uncharacterized membrane protein